MCENPLKNQLPRFLKTQPEPCQNPTSSFRIRLVFLLLRLVILLSAYCRNLSLRNLKKYTIRLEYSK